MADGVKKNKKNPKHVIREAIAKRQRVPHLDEIVEYLVAKWGGPEQLAGAMYEIYMDEKTSQQVKGQVITKVLDLMRITSERLGATDELDDLTEEEILKMLEMEATPDGHEESS